MLKKLGRPAILGIIVAVLLLAIVSLTIFNSEVGMAKNTGIQEPSLPKCDYSAVPGNVIDNAKQMAEKAVGTSKERVQDFVDELVSMYVESRDKDVVIFFNSGGMGWNLTTDTPGWASILDGITEQLDKLGYRSLVLNYRRTSSGLVGCVREILEAANRYPRKAEELADRVEFLTDNLPNLKIIIAGESTGTVISDKTMRILEQKQSVYSIQTGMPFWHKPGVLERTLSINSNGRGIDTFSYGNIPAMIWATVKSWLGLSSPNDNPGNILSWLKAPGHDYSWQYTGVCAAITKFLDKNFGGKD